MTELDTHIEKSKHLADWIGEQIEGLELKSDNRTRVAGALMGVSLGHYASIIELFGVGRHASALALMRSMIDCFVRSQWVAHLATDQEIDGFVEGNDPAGGTQGIIARLENSGPLDQGILSSILSPTQWAIVCDFNHGGGRMVVRHLTGNEISPNFDAAEILEAITAANAWALVSACALADLAHDNALGARLLEEGSKLAA